MATGRAEKSALNAHSPLSRVHTRMQTTERAHAVASIHIPGGRRLPQWKIGGQVLLRV